MDKLRYGDFEKITFGAKKVIYNDAVYHYDASRNQWISSDPDDEKFTEDEFCGLIVMEVHALNFMLEIHLAK